MDGRPMFDATVHVARAATCPSEFAASLASGRSCNSRETWGVCGPSSHCHGSCVWIGLLASLVGCGSFFVAWSGPTALGRPR
jgi:hypothetical protein